MVLCNKLKYIAVLYTDSYLILFIKHLFNLSFQKGDFGEGVKRRELNGRAGEGMG